MKKTLISMLSILFVLGSLSVSANIVNHGDGKGKTPSPDSIVTFGVENDQEIVEGEATNNMVKKELIILYPTQAEPMRSSILLNGNLLERPGYLINDNNYMKLRDIAYMINGTEKQFEVEYNEENDLIQLTSKKPYTSVGGENQDKGSENKDAKPTSSKIAIDGKEIQLPAYVIEDNNYFRLRDIGECFNFYVGWNEYSNTIVIDTNQNYKNIE